MKTLRRRRAPLVFVCFLIACVGLSAQEEEEVVAEAVKPVRQYRPRERNLVVDIPLTVGEFTLINLVGNLYWRLWGPDAEAAYFTAESIRYNMNPRVWGFEEGLGGDTFLTNQFIHPYAGGLYFASARSNNFNFYWSALSAALGSLTWEALGETDSPSASDLINTTFGGIAIGEILHRLYLELDKGGPAGKIGATILSPTDRITAAVRGYGPEKGPSRIRDSSLALGFSWINARFFDDNEKMTSWDNPSAFIGLDLVYGDPYTAYSKTPYEQFDLSTSLTIGIPFFHNFVFITDGYLASWLLADDDLRRASGGLSLHFDTFVTDKGFMDLNSGRENLSFNANSLDYTLKWLGIRGKSFEFSVKAHIGLSPWAVTNYNGGINRDDYNLYSFGGNIKLFLELRQKKEDDGAKNVHSLALSVCFYDTWDIPRTPGFDANTLFLFSKLAYSFPIAGTFSFYVANSFQLLHCRLKGSSEYFPDITRWYNSVHVGIKKQL